MQQSACHDHATSVPQKTPRLKNHIEAGISRPNRGRYDRRFKRLTGRRFASKGRAMTNPDLVDATGTIFHALKPFPALTALIEPLRDVIASQGDDSIEWF